MRVDAASLLLGTTPETEEKELVNCQSCDFQCDPDVDICPECGEPPRKITLEELGRRLPIGIINNVDGKDILLKDFEVVALNWKKEREVASAWIDYQKRGNVFVLDYLVCVLAHCVTMIGSTNFQKHSFDKRMNILFQMFGGDIFYMYAYLRVFSMGGEFTLMGTQCPRCNFIIKEYPVDLNTLEVSTRSKVENINSEIELRDGIEIMGERRKKLTFRPLPFNVFAHSMLSGDDDDSFFVDAMQQSVCKIEGVEDGVVVTEKEIDSLTPYDLAMIRDKNDWMSGGPEWTVTVKCPKCKSEFDYLIPWSHGDFFSLSYRSRMRRAR